MNDALGDPADDPADDPAGVRAAGLGTTGVLALTIVALWQLAAT